MLAQWQYKVFYLEWTSPYQNEWTERLDAAGHDGWELVSVVGNDVGVRVFMKRPTPQGLR